MNVTDCDEQDAQDMTLLARGHDAALNSLMERHDEKLFHYLIRSLQDESEAADLAQERALESGSAPAPPPRPDPDGAFDLQRPLAVGFHNEEAAGVFAPRAAEVGEARALADPSLARSVIAVSISCHEP